MAGAMDILNHPNPLGFWMQIRSMRTTIDHAACFLNRSSPSGGLPSLSGTRNTSVPRPRGQTWRWAGPGRATPAETKDSAGPERASTSWQARIQVGGMTAQELHFHTQIENVLRKQVFAAGLVFTNLLNHNTCLFTAQGPQFNLNSKTTADRNGNCTQFTAKH